MVHDLVRPAAHDCPADVHVVVKQTVPRRVRAVVARLRREPPGRRAYLQHVLHRRGAGERRLALPIQRPRVVCKQPQALPQVSVHLLAVARLPVVDGLHHAFDLVPAQGGLVREPRSEGVEVPVGGVQMLPSRIVDHRL